MSMKTAFAKHDFRTGQFSPAIRFEDGHVETFSPTSFDEARALQIATGILAVMDGPTHYNPDEQHECEEATMKGLR